MWKLIRKITGRNRSDGYYELRAELAKLEREEDALTGWNGSGFDPGPLPMDLERVFACRDRQAEIMEQLGWRNQAKALRADTAARRRWSF